MNSNSYVRHFEDSLEQARDFVGYINHIIRLANGK